MSKINLTKKQFVSILDGLQKQFAHDSKCCDAFEVILPEASVCLYNNNHIVKPVVDLLVELMGDNREANEYKIGLIDYFIYDIDFGRDVREGNDNIADAGKLYDYLVELSEEKKKKT